MPNAISKDLSLKGEKTRFFYIGTLAKKLNRSTHSIRMWIVRGIIPETWFKDHNGNRLYTQEMIDAIVSSAEENDISRGRCIATTNFSIDCHAKFEELRKLYGGKSNGTEEKEKD